MLQISIENVPHDELELSEENTRIRSTTEYITELLLDVKTSSKTEPAETLQSPLLYSILYSILKRYHEKLSLSSIEAIPRFRRFVILPEVRLLVQTLFSPPQIRTLSISPEVQEILEKDEYSKIVLDNVLLEIQETLDLRDENYTVNVSLEQDIEVPEWREIVVAIQVRERDYNEKMNLWEEIEEKVRAKIEQIQSRYPPKEQKIIDKIYQNLSIEIEENDTLI